jgi:hypothetical protein
VSVYLLTASTNAWASDPAMREWLDEQADRFEAGRSFDRDSWSTRRRFGFECGQRFYLLLQGAGLRGIIASGEIASDTVGWEESWRRDGTKEWYIDVKWDAFVPWDKPLPTPLLKKEAPSTHWHPQGSGSTIKSVDEDVVEELWLKHLTGLGLRRP